MTKRYYVERMGRRLFETTSFAALKTFLSHREDADDLTLFTSDYEPQCGDQWCDCKEQLGFNSTEREALEEMEIYVG